MPYIDILIDKITNSIEEKATGKTFETAIEKITDEEIRKIYKKDGWRFQWKTEYLQPGHQIYKLVTKVGDRHIQGLISIEPLIALGYIELHLIEVAPHNYGSNKKFFGVAGNLVAFACKTSFDLGLEGYVAFTAKTELIQHYINTLGANLIYGYNRMAITTNAAKKLVNSYYKNYLHGG